MIKNDNKRKVVNSSLMVLLSILLFGLLEAGDFNFALTMTVDDAQGSSYDLTFGFSPDATDDFDQGIDALAPPAPPGGFDAALKWPVNDARYFKQILAGTNDDIQVEHVYEVALQYDTNELIHISWENSGWDTLGTFLLQDAFDGGLGINVDMTVDNSLTLTNSAFNSLRLKVTPSGASLSIDSDEMIPSQFALHGNFPNPFNPETTIRFDLDVRSDLSVTVFTLLGEEVIRLYGAVSEPGRYSVKWNAKDRLGRNMPSGLYLYRVLADDRTLTGKMLLVR